MLSKGATDRDISPPFFSPDPNFQVLALSQRKSMTGHAGFLLGDLQRELAENEHQLSELEVILTDYNEERFRLVREISRLQARLRDAAEEMQSQAHLQIKRSDRPSRGLES